MKKMRLIALVLACAMLLCVFTGCSGKETEFGRLYNSMAPDTVIARVGGTEITWDMYCATLYTSIAALEGSYGQIPPWERQLDETSNYSDFVKEYALYDALYYAVLENMALDLGIVLNAADETTIEEMWQGYAAQLGGEKEFVENLESMYCTADVYRYMLRMQYTTEKILDVTYGEGGALITDEQIDKYVEDAGYYMAKIIVILTRDPETGEAYDDVKRTRLLTRAKDIVKQLDEYTGDDIEAFFDEISARENEDAAKEYFPNGYIFGETDLSTIVYNATGKLEEYEYSNVVSSDYGYYIILRLPIDETITPVAHANTLYYGSSYPLRTVVADSFLNQDIADLQASIEVERTDAYKSLFLGDYLTEPVTLVTEEK